MEDTTSCIFCYSRVSPPEQNGVVEGEEENGWRSVGKLQQFIEQFGLDFKPEVVNNLCNSICEGCFSSLGKIVEFKKQADKVEGRVRALQKQVLEQMNELHNCLEKFHDELKYMVRNQIGGKDDGVDEDQDGGMDVKVNPDNLEGVLQRTKQVCSEDAALLRNKVVEVVRNRNFPQFTRRVPPTPPATPKVAPSSNTVAAVPGRIKLVNTKRNPVTSIIPISIPAIPGLAKLNRKRKGDEISKSTKKDGGGGDVVDVDSEIEILEEAPVPPKACKKEKPTKKIPSPCTSDSTMKSSSLSEEDSDDGDSLFTPITKPSEPAAVAIGPRVNDPKLERMLPAVALKRLSPGAPGPARTKNEVKLEKTEGEGPAEIVAAPTSGINKRIIYFGDSESSSSSSSSEEEDQEPFKPLISFSPKFKVSKWRQRIILGLFGKEKFELGEKRRRAGKGDFKEKWSLDYNKGTNKLSYGGIRIVFWEEDKCIGCGGRKGRKACDFRTSHVESHFFEGIKGHIERCHLGEGGGEEEEGNEEDADWDEDISWAVDHNDKEEEEEEEEETDEVVEVDVEGKRRSERVVKPPERLICEGEDKREDDKQGENEEEEICKVCGKGFRDKRQLKIHIWDYHGDVDKLGGDDEKEDGGKKSVPSSLEEKFKVTREKGKISSEDEDYEEEDDEDTEDENCSLLEI